MENRIRCAALILNTDKILLVKHVHPETKKEWWVPPGGGIEESDANIFQCAIRETYEETGLTINADKVVYLREFTDLEFKRRNLEIFVLASMQSGALTLDHLHGHGVDENYIKDVQWFDHDEIQRMTVFPELLKDQFWEDVAASFKEVRYLGAHSG